jgi:hypothetical protein
LTRQIDQFGAPRVITVKGLLTAPNGGSARVQQDTTHLGIGMVTGARAA